MDRSLVVRVREIRGGAPTRAQRRIVVRSAAVRAAGIPAAGLEAERQQILEELLPTEDVDPELLPALRIAPRVLPAPA